MLKPPSLHKGWKSLLLISICTCLFVCTVFQAIPVLAGQVMSWRFDRTANRLELTTSAPVQPQAQLLPNPTRIVLDLPDTTLGRPRLDENIGGPVQTLRIAQFDADTTRFVIELAAGYTINPQDIQIQGISPTRWVVQLPTLQPVTNPSPVSGSLGTPPPTPSIPSTPGLQAATALQGWQQTPDGLFLRTQGATPRINVRRSRDRRTVELDILDTALAATLQNAKVAFPDLGVEQLQFEQSSKNPPQVRLTLRLVKNPPDWQVSVSNLGGIILLPQGGVSISPRTPPISTTPALPSTPTPPSLSQVQSVGFNLSRSQLQIQTSGAVNYQGTWNSGEYQIALTPAQLSPTVRGPQMGPDSPLLRVRLHQTDAQTVTIGVQPSASVQIDALQAVSDRLLVLPLSGSLPITVPNPRIPTVPQPSYPTPEPNFPINPTNPGNRRAMVIIDPGHGGPDPGAVGIGGLQEKDVVLDMSRQVAALLQQQGLQVALTRTGDYDLDLEPRVRMAEQANADLFVSIHANAVTLGRPEVNGLETYYASGDGQALASTILKRILNTIPMTNRGVKQANFYVIRRTSMPATLIETGFVTGSEDAPRLADPNFRRQMSAAIAQGILDYLR